jgi:hypothetical protein
MLLQELFKTATGESHDAIAARIGKEFKVDFEDADGAAAKKAMIAMYKQGYKDGIHWADGERKELTAQRK